MPRTNHKNNDTGFGKTLLSRDKKKKEDTLTQFRAIAKGEIAAPHVTEGARGGESRSVMEQSSIDELLQTIEVRREEWFEAYGDATEAREGATLIDLTAPLAQLESKAAMSRECLSIPRRPKWNEGMSIEELAELESVAFLEWRRGLAEMQEEGGLIMTPYERNLDFWRQLWRCMERSDLVVQVLDARDPDFYFCQDLYRYISELGGSKRLLLLVNKADYLSKEQRQAWATHFETKGIDAIFFSALLEVQKLSSHWTDEDKCKVHTDDREDEEARVSDKAKVAEPATSSDAADVPIPDSDDDLNESEAQVDDSSDDEDEAIQIDANDTSVTNVPGLLDAVRSRLQKCAEDRGDDEERQGVVGFVGYPNVGKSTVINAIVGAKKVGMSRTAGKTKHIQTLCVPEWGFTVCDAPGLIFPSVVASKAHLVISNTIPLETLVDAFAPLKLIVEKIGFAEIMRRYKCTPFVKEAALRVGACGKSGDHVLDETHSFLTAFALSRKHMLRAGVPDAQWAARKVLHEYCAGKLLHCEPPPGTVTEDGPASSPAAFAPPGRGADDEARAAEELRLMQEENFDDLDDMMDDDAATSVAQKPMTKKAQRHMLKMQGKGLSTLSTQQKKALNARATALG